MSRESVYSFSDMGNLSAPGRLRTTIDVHVPRTVSVPLWAGGTEVAWPEGVIADVTEGTKPEDMPWSGAVHVVSARFRELIERHCPGDAIFLPIGVRRNGRPFGPAPYWVAHWVRALDCLDRERSKSFVMKLRNGQTEEVFTSPCVDLAKVPPEVQVWRARPPMSSVFIRDEMRSKIEDAKLSGCQFYPVAYING